jgi:hypothetical protein
VCQILGSDTRVADPLSSWVATVAEQLIQNQSFDQCVRGILQIYQVPWQCCMRRDGPKYLSAVALAKRAQGHGTTGRKKKARSHRAFSRTAKHEILDPRPTWAMVGAGAVPFCTWTS